MQHTANGHTFNHYPVKKHDSDHSFLGKLLERVKKHKIVAIVAAAGTLATGGVLAKELSSSSSSPGGNEPVATAPVNPSDSPSQSPSPEVMVTDDIMPQAMTDREIELRASYFTIYDTDTEQQIYYKESALGAINLYRYVEIGLKINRYEAKANEDIRNHTQDLLEGLLETNPDIFESPSGLPYTLSTARTEKGISQTLITTASSPNTSFGGKITATGEDAWTDRIGLLPHMREYFETIESCGFKEAYKIFTGGFSDWIARAEKSKSSGDLYSYAEQEIRAFESSVFAATIEEVYGL